MLFGSFPKFLRVILLTPIFLVLTGACVGCSVVKELAETPRYGEQCNSRAFVQSSLSGFIQGRFQQQNAVRLAVVPFSTPASLAARSAELPGLGNDIAWRIHSEFLRTGQVPIVEVLNRQDWPGKKDEFFAGNFGAVSAARDAGYDFVLVGIMEMGPTPTSLVASSKLIETASGITVWYGQSTASTDRTRTGEAYFPWSSDQRKPALLYTEQVLAKLASCVVGEVTRDREVPGDQGNFESPAAIAYAPRVGGSPAARAQVNIPRASGAKIAW